MCVEFYTHRIYFYSRIITYRFGVQTILVLFRLVSTENDVISIRGLQSLVQTFFSSDVILYEIILLRFFPFYKRYLIISWLIKLFDQSRHYSKYIFVLVIHFLFQKS